MIEATITRPMGFVGTWAGVYIFGHIPERSFQLLVLALSPRTRSYYCSRRFRNPEFADRCRLSGGLPATVRSIATGNVKRHHAAAEQERRVRDRHVESAVV